MTVPSPPSSQPVPTAVHNSFLCWMALLVLVALGFLISLAGRAVSVGGLLELALALLAAFGALQMRAGRPVGRMLAAVAGAVLGALQLLGLFLLVFVGGLTSYGQLGFVVLILGLVKLGLMVGGFLLMFRPEASAYIR